MKKFAKILSLLLAIACLAAVLCACGDGKPGGTEGNEKYKFTKYENTKLATADLLAGNIDVICLPTNEAANYRAEEVLPDTDFDNFLKLDLRVGTVLACERVPKMKKLLK